MPPKQAAALYSCDDSAQTRLMQNMQDCYTLMLPDSPLDLPYDAAFVNHPDISWIAENNCVRRSDAYSIVVQSNHGWQNQYDESERENITAHLIHQPHVYR